MLSKYSTTVFSHGGPNCEKTKTEDCTSCSATWRRGFSEGFSAGFVEGFRLGHQRGHPTTSNPSSSNENGLFQFWGSQGWESYGQVHQLTLHRAWTWWNVHGASVEEAAAACPTLTDGHANFKVQLGCLAEYHAHHRDVVGWQDLQDGGDKRWVRLAGFESANVIWLEMDLYGITQRCQPSKLTTSQPQTMLLRAFAALTTAPLLDAALHRLLEGALHRSTVCSVCWPCTGPRRSSTVAAIAWQIQSLPALRCVLKAALLAHYTALQFVVCVLLATCRPTT